MLPQMQKDHYKISKQFSSAFVVASFFPSMSRTASKKLFVFNLALK